MATTRRRQRWTAAAADRYRLYELAVQDVESEIDFVDRTYRRLRGRPARRLREDFCGTAATCCEWVRRRPTNVAIGLDLDPEVLAWGRAHNLVRLGPTRRRRVRLVQADVRHPPPGARRVDIVMAMNFSYFTFRTRADMRDYFRATLGSLARGGLFFLDYYGGYEAFRVQREKRDIDRRFTYIWDQREINPVTGEIRCYIHFAFRDGSRLERAFCYDWRLWTLPELRDLLDEVGFARTTVYCEGDDGRGGGDGQFRPVERCDPDASFIAYIVAER